MYLSGSDTDSLLPGRHQGDAEVQLGGAAAEDGWHEPPGHPDADAHEAVQGPEELLHCWVNIKNLFMDFLTIFFFRFALFLCLVIKRLVGLISANAGLQVHIAMLLGSDVNRCKF